MDNDMGIKSDMYYGRDFCRDDKDQRLSMETTDINMEEVCRIAEKERVGVFALTDGRSGCVITNDTLVDMKGERPEWFVGAYNRLFYTKESGFTVFVWFSKDKTWVLPDGWFVIVDNITAEDSNELASEWAEIIKNIRSQKTTFTVTGY